MNQPTRLLSLDVFRGMTIAFMILVNTPGSWSHIYPPLRHADWHGVTPTDLVFPFFLFIVGVSLFLSSAKFDHQLSKQATLKILKRGFMIFAIGLALHWFPFSKSVNEIRIMGVLQRIALAYILGAFLCLGLSIQQLWRAGLILLTGYWVIMSGFGGEDPYGFETNLARRIDLAILGKNHVWQQFGVKYDPEGLLSTIPSIVTVIFGYYIGWIIKTVNDRHLVVKNLLIIGVITIFLGKAWDIYFPINKALWTSSYVLYVGGIASCFLAILIELIDIRGLTGWTKPFQVFGLNPLIIYVLSGLIVKTFFMVKWVNDSGDNRNVYSWLYNDVYAALLPNNLKLASLLFALTMKGPCDRLPVPRNKKCLYRIGGSHFSDF